jgi:hypothetical protein
MFATLALTINELVTHHAWKNGVVLVLKRLIGGLFYGDNKNVKISCNLDLFCYVKLTVRQGQFYDFEISL